MSITALTLAFMRDHFRTKAAAFELIMVLLFLLFFLNPKEGPYDPSFLGVYINFAGIALSGIVTALVAWRNADHKLDVLVLRAGRSACYLGVFFAALLITTFWTGLITVYAFGVLPLSAQVTPALLLRLAAAIIPNMLVVVAIFALFSGLSGRAIEPAYAIILVTLGLGDISQFGLARHWQSLGVLFPPILENVQAGAGAASEIETIRSIVYFLVALSAGLFRFSRRQFIWS